MESKDIIIVILICLIFYSFLKRYINYSKRSQMCNKNPVIYKSTSLLQPPIKKNNVQHNNTHIATNHSLIDLPVVNQYAPQYEHNNQQIIYENSPLEHNNEQVPVIHQIAPVLQTYQMESINSNVINEDNESEEFESEYGDEPVGNHDNDQTELNVHLNYDLEKTFNYDKKIIDELEHFDNEDLYMEV